MVILEISEAENIFNNIPMNKKDVITINSMLTAYLDNSQAENVLSLYDEILESQPHLMDDIHIYQLLERVLEVMILKKVKYSCTNSNKST